MNASPRTFKTYSRHYWCENNEEIGEEGAGGMKNCMKKIFDGSKTWRNEKK